MVELSRHRRCRSSAWRPPRIKVSGGAMWAGLSTCLYVVREEGELGGEAMGGH